MRYKFGNRHIYKVPQNNHLFYSEDDAKYWCREHGCDLKKIVKFDSKKEYERYLQLKQMEEAGLISDLQRQVVFVIIPEHRKQVETGYKFVADYNVENNHFAKKKDALEYCKQHDLSSSSIWKTTQKKMTYKMKVVEKEAVYTADFVYLDRNGDKVVEDVKSEITRKEPDYVLRRKLMLDRHGIEILET